LEENEVMKFKLSRLENEMESMKEEFKKELGSLKYVLNSIKEEILNEIRFHLTHKSSTGEVKESKDVESQTLMGKYEVKLKKKKFESVTYDLSSLQVTLF
jgi:hypothetical protein